MSISSVVELVHSVSGCGWDERTNGANGISEDGDGHGSSSVGEQAYHCQNAEFGISCVCGGCP